MSENSDTENKSSDIPAPEPLKVKSDSAPVADESKESKNVSQSSKANANHRRVTYRPSHRATFIGISVIVGILIINAVVIGFILNGQTNDSTSVNKEQVTINSDALDQLGVNRSTVGSSGVELKIGPDTSFNGEVSVAGNTSIAGQLSTNNKLSAPIASLTKLEAGDTSIDLLNVNGDATISNLNLRGGLIVAGSTQLQGTLTVGQLLTVNNNVNIAGNVSVGGVLSVNQLHVSSLTSDSALTVGGHIITAGLQPSYSRGGALRATDTISMSGNDISGTIQVNIGAGSIGAGTIIQVAFRSPYSNTPHVVVSPVGGGGLSGYYVNRSSSGFSIGISGSLSYGGYAFDYIVTQ
jgi:hypothetical protein